MRNRHGPATVMPSKPEYVTEKSGRPGKQGSKVRRTACLISPFDPRAMGREMYLSSLCVRVKSFFIGPADQLKIE